MRKRGNRPAPFCRPDAARRHRLAGGELSRRAEKLGYEAWYVEDHGANPYDPRISSVVMDCDYNVGYLREAMERHGFAGRWAYWDAINDVYHGLSASRCVAFMPRPTR